MFRPRVLRKFSARSRRAACCWHLPLSPPQCGEFAGQFVQTDGLDAAADGKACVVAVDDKRPIRLHIVNGGVQRPLGGCPTKLDFHHPALAVGEFQNQVRFHAGGRAIEAGFGSLWRSLQQGFDSEPLPARSRQGVAVERLPIV